MVIMSAYPPIRRVAVAPDVMIPYLDQGAAHGIAVVLIHALGDSLRSYEPVLAHLPDDVRVVVPSLRGHGDADRPEQGYTPVDFARDIAALLRDAQIESAVLVGHSSGAQTAQQFALTYPQRTSGLILIGAPGTIHTHPGVVEFDQVFGALSDPIDPAFLRALTLSQLAQPIAASFLDTLVAERLKVPARVIIATWAGSRDFDITRELSLIQAPTLVVWGDQDRVAVASREAQEQLVAAIPGARFVVYGGAGHHVHWEEPARFAMELLSFVGSLPA
jgi:pimeloyl-ACP methyl ester carboxylesterase